MPVSYSPLFKNGRKGTTLTFWGGPCNHTVKKKENVIVHVLPKNLIIENVWFVLILPLIWPKLGKKHRGNLKSIWNTPEKIKTKKKVNSVFRNMVHKSRCVLKKNPVFTKNSWQNLKFVILLRETRTGEKHTNLQTLLTIFAAQI